jgi:hypothetical protein
MRPKVRSGPFDLLRQRNSSAIAQILIQHEAARREPLFKCEAQSQSLPLFYTMPLTWALGRIEISWYYNDVWSGLLFYSCSMEAKP